MSASVYRQFDRNNEKCTYAHDFVMFVHPLIPRDCNSRDRWTHPKTDTSHPAPSSVSSLPTKGVLIHMQLTSLSELKQNVLHQLHDLFDLYKPSWNFSGKIWHPPVLIYGSKSNPSADEYEIRMVMTGNSIVLWEVTMRCVAQIYRRFGVNYLRPISTGFHVVTSEETVMFSHSTGSLFDIRHSEHRASWSILIMKANEMQYFSNLFDKILDMFRTGPLSIIRSISTRYTRNRYLSR